MTAPHTNEIIAAPHTNDKFAAPRTREPIATDRQAGNKCSSLTDFSVVQLFSSVKIWARNL